MIEGTLSRRFAVLHSQPAFIQFARFAVVGVANTLIDFCTYVALTRFLPFFPDHIFLANTLSFIVAASFSYVANKRWTFEHDASVTVGEAVKFFATTGTGFLLGLGTLFVCVKIFGIYDLVGKVAATGVTVTWNFLLNKFWVFSK